LGRMPRRGCVRLARPRASRPPPAGEEVPQEPMQAVELPGLCSATKSTSASRKSGTAPQRGGLGIYLRQPFVARGGQRGGDRHRVRRSCERWAPPPQPTRLSPPASPPGAYPESARAFSTAQRRWEKRLAHRFRGLSIRGALVRRRQARGARLWRLPLRLKRRLMGIEPDQDLLMSARTSVSVGALPLVRQGHCDFGCCSHTTFESLLPPGTGGRQA
jgi:hypothetical protein